MADEAVEPGRRRGRAEPGIPQRERFLARIEIELPAEILIVEKRVLEPAQRRVDGLRCLVHGGVLPIADEVWPERDAERSVPEDEPALPLPFSERRRTRVREARILQELVVRDKRVACGLRAPPC